jgi:hypothetical protein
MFGGATAAPAFSFTGGAAPTAAAGASAFNFAGGAAPAGGLGMFGVCPLVKARARENFRLFHHLPNDTPHERLDELISRSSAGWAGWAEGFDQDPRLPTDPDLGRMDAWDAEQVTQFFIACN